METSGIQGISKTQTKTPSGLYEDLVQVGMRDLVKHHGDGKLDVSLYKNAEESVGKETDSQYAFSVVVVVMVM